jgi:hypothetical protein
MTNGIDMMVTMGDAAATASANKDEVSREHTGTPTEIALKEMLTENTGAAMLDSGGIYGRHWQRNQVRDFDAEPEVSLKFEVYNKQLHIEFTLNTYHWLKERLEYSEEMNTLFDGRFRQEVDEDDRKSWYELREEFPKYLAQLRGEPDENVGDECPECEKGTLQMEDGQLVCSEDDCRAIFEGELRFGEFGGIYGEGEPMTINTYNGEDALDQTLLYTLFSGDAGDFVALQIHGGCDVRGGYTKPRIFEFGLLSELDILDNARGTIFCSGEDHLPGVLELHKLKKNLEVARKNRASHRMRFRPHTKRRFCTEHRCFMARKPKVSEELLDEIDISDSTCIDHNWTTYDAGYSWYYQGSCGLGAGKQLEDYEIVDLDDEDNTHMSWEPGKLFIKDGEGYCPHCGSKLQGSSY